MITAEICLEEMVDIYHYPVMYREVLSFLNLRDKKIVVDCTAGLGSHASKMLSVMKADSFFIGVDRDKESLDLAYQRTKDFSGRIVFVKENFGNIDKVLASIDIHGVDAFLFDFGISSYQLGSSQRGFSFLKDGPLDMRMDKDLFLSAYDLVNNLSELELESIFRKFGEERYSRKIAHSIVEGRRKEQISSTTQLAQIITNAIPVKNRYSRIHPATRIFQALRIVVNRELDAISDGLRKSIPLLNKGGRIAVISFHSLEDRIVKNIFKEFAADGVIDIITKKPLIPTEEEINENSPSRSAKLRVIEKR